MASEDAIEVPLRIEDWSSFVETLYESLSQLLGVRVSMQHYKLVDGESFHSTGGSERPMVAQPRVDLRVILGMEPIEEKPHVSASVFMTLDDGSFLRCAAALNHGSYALFTFDALKGSWQFEGWETDVYDEFENYEWS